MHLLKIQENPRGLKNSSSQPSVLKAGGREGESGHCIVTTDHIHLSAEGSGFRLCPMDWLLCGDKCYWVSLCKTKTLEL